MVGRLGRESDGVEFEFEEVNDKGGRLLGLRAGGGGGGGSVSEVGKNRDLRSVVVGAGGELVGEGQPRYTEVGRGGTARGI
jgi:hypothetical protein